MNNKQVKQTLNKKKHVGLYLGLGFGLAGIVAGSTAAIVVTLNKNSIPKNKVLFNAGSNHTFASNQTNRFVDCANATDLVNLSSKLKLYSKNNSEASDFVGWAYTKDFSHGKVSKNKILSADTKIQPQSSITAVYKTTVADEGISWKTVSFERGSSASTANITGNTKFNIISGTCLREINCPTCEPKVAGEMKFVNWKKLGDTQPFGRNVPITTDTKFEPIMSAAAKITFVAPTGAVIVGLDTVTVSEGTKFSDINTPIVECTSTSDIFYGWYEDSACTKLFSGDKQISGDNVKAYAKIINKSDTNITVVTADTMTGVSYEGNTSFAIARNSIWSSYNRPIPKKENEKLAYWEYSIDGGSSWKKGESTTTFGDIQAARIRPVFESTISGVIITNDPAVLAKNQPTTIKATVLPVTSAQTVTWKLFSDETCETEVTSGASITDAGVVTVTDTYTEDKIYIQATSTVDTSRSGSTGFTFANPYVDSNCFWMLNETEGEGLAKGWYRLENLCDPRGTGNIELWKEGATAATKTISRSVFSQKIYVGDKVTSIPSNFLKGCSAFNADIEFTGATNDDYSVKVGDNFMYGCSAFNKELNVSKFANIGSNFLYGANAFTNNNQPLSFDIVYSIGDNFLKEHSTFNQSIGLGSYITRIGNSFLEGAKAFNKNITLPASLTNIGSHFMFECDNFAYDDETTGTITADCPLSAFDTNVENLSAKSESAAIYNKGFKVAGARIADLPYTTIKGTKGGYWRKNLSTKAVESLEVSTPASKNEFKVDETFTTAGLSLLVTFDDTSTAEISSGWTSSPYTEGYKFTEGDIGDGKLITITYGGKSIEYYIDVKSKGTETDLPSYLGSVDTGSNTIGVYAKSSITDVDLEIKSTYKINGVDYTVTSLATNTETSTGPFQGHTELQSIILPDTLTRIEPYAFYGSGVSMFTIPSSVTFIGNYLHNPNDTEHHLTGLTFAEVGTTWKFSDTGSTEFVPTEVAADNIAAYNAHYENDLTKVETAADLPGYFDYQDDPDGTGIYIGLKNGVELPKTLIINSKYNIDQVGEKTVTGLYDRAFYKEEGSVNLTSITLPNTIKYLGSTALSNTQITSITIPESVTTIGSGCFKGTNTLTSMTFVDTTSSWTYTPESGSPESWIPSATKLDANAERFVSAAVTGPHTKDEAEELPEHFELVYNQTLKIYGIKPAEGKDIPPDLEIKSKYKAKDGNVRTVQFVEGFNDVPLASLQLPSTLLRIEASTFFGTTLTDITVPASVSYIGTNAFDEVTLTKLKFEDTTTPWSYNSTETFIPAEKAESNATKYRETLFKYELTKVTDTLPEYYQINTDATTGKNTLSLNIKYEGSYPDKLEIKESYVVGGVTKKIDAVAKFQPKSGTATSNVTEISIAEGITEISSEFCNITTIQTVTIPSTVKIIGQSAFDTTALTTFNISASNWASYDTSTESAPSLVKFYGESSSDIGTYKSKSSNRFECADCPNYLALSSDSNAWAVGMAGETYTGPASLTISDYYVDPYGTEIRPVKYINSEGFKNATTLTSITLPQTIEQIGIESFVGSGITSINIPASVTNIYVSAFSTGMKYIYFDDVTTGWTGPDGSSTWTPGTGEENAAKFVEWAAAYPNNTFITKN